jgi:two-component system, LuxR family, sensor kinase FixL
MQNLVNNAAKFSENQKNAEIYIGSRRDANETIYFVKDNGIGISPAYHDKVFGLFDQRDQNVDGTGIGLVKVKRMIKVHGKRIWIESEGGGKGSRFFVFQTIWY